MMDTNPTDCRSELATSQGSQSSSEGTAASMTPPLINGHKRSRSASESESAPKTTAVNQNRQFPPRMVLLHLSALLACEEAITSVSRTLAAAVFPEEDLPKFTTEAIISAYSKSPLAWEILGAIIGRELTCEEATRAKECYTRIHLEVGGPLLGAAPHAKEFLEALRRHRDEIKFAVISQNPPAAAATLSQIGLGHLVEVIIPRIHISAHSAAPPTATAALHTHFTRMVSPTFTALCHGGPTLAAAITPEAAAALAPLQPSQALVVSCGLYDLTIAQPGGMRTCWVRRIRDRAQAEEAVREAGAVGVAVGGGGGGGFDLVVEGLGEVCGWLFGEGGGELGGGEEALEGGRGEQGEQGEQGGQGTGGGVVVAAAADAADGTAEEVAESSSEEEEAVSLSGGDDSEVEVVRVVRVTAAAAEEV